MPVDKSKQIYSWFTNNDIELHCVCGEYIQLSSEIDEGSIIVCKNCGQEWWVELTVEMRNV